MSDQEARKIMLMLHDRYRFRSRGVPPDRDLLARFADGTNLRLAMLQFGIELLVQHAVGQSDQFAAGVSQSGFGLSGWTLEAYTETPAGSPDPVSIDMTFRLRLGDPNDPLRAARAAENTVVRRVLVTRIDQRLTFDLGQRRPRDVQFLRVMAGIFPGSGVVRIEPDPSAPPPRARAGRPRSTSAPHAPSRP